MRFRRYRDRCLGLAVPAALAAFSPHPAGAQTTSWTAGLGDWGTAANWSDGEPTADVDAEMPITGTAIVTLAGETCRRFTMGAGGSGSVLRINTGSLTVVERLHVGAGFSSTVQHFGGTLSAGELVLGDLAPAAYSMTGGTLTLGSARIGDDSPSSGTFSTGAGSLSCTIMGSLRIAPGGSFVFGAGTLNVGASASDTTVVEGAFQIANLPAISMTGFKMSDDGALHVLILPTGVSTIMVTGAAVLNGQLLITEVGAPNGTYEILRGNPLQGTFDMATLPDDWAWRVEGNSLLVTKGQVPVERSSWGGIKSRFER